MGSSFGLRKIANMIDFIDAAVRISFRTVLLSYFFVLPIELGVVKLEAAEALIKGDAATNKGWRCWHWEMFIFIFIFIFIFDVVSLIFCCCHITVDLELLVRTLLPYALSHLHMIMSHIFHLALDAAALTAAWGVGTNAVCTSM